MALNLPGLNVKVSDMLAALEKVAGPAVRARVTFQKDERIAAIAEKTLKEVNYHVRWSSEWVIRLGDGTAESHRRLEQAIQDLWLFTGELFTSTHYEIESGVDVALLRSNWEEKIRSNFEEASAEMPTNVFARTGGKTGLHSEHLGFMLAELQYLQRSFPGCEW